MVKKVLGHAPEHSAQVFSKTSSTLEFVRADVGDDGSVPRKPVPPKTVTFRIFVI
jgi:hypothetical protein